MRLRIIGVMGGAAADRKTCATAYRLGQLIADAGYVLLNGGRSGGVMDHSARGAKSRGGVTVGVLPGVNPDQAGKDIDLALATGMGDARNLINVLSSELVIACAGGAGTLSEVALALKSGRRVIAVGLLLGKVFAPFEKSGLLTYADNAEEAMNQAGTYLARVSRSD